MKTKYCGGCDKTKPIDEFFRNRDSKDGYHSQCKVCDKTRAVNWAKAHRKKINEKIRELYWQKKGEPQPKQQEFAATRPTCGPRCKTCGLVLYHYDIKRGECFTHAQERHIQFWNQPVRMTQSAAASD